MFGETTAPTIACPIRQAFRRLVSVLLAVGEVRCGDAGAG